MPSLQSVILGCADTKALVVDASHGNPSFFAPVGRAFLGSTLLSMTSWVTPPTHDTDGTTWLAGGDEAGTVSIWDAAEFVAHARECPGRADAAALPAADHHL